MERPDIQGIARVQAELSTLKNSRKSAEKLPETKGDVPQGPLPYKAIRRYPQHRLVLLFYVYFYEGRTCGHVLLRSNR